MCDRGIDACQHTHTHTHKHMAAHIHTDSIQTDTNTHTHIHYTDVEHTLALVTCLGNTYVHVRMHISTSMCASAA